MLEPVNLSGLRSRQKHDAEQEDYYQADDKRNSDEERSPSGFNPVHTLYIILFDILSSL